LRYTALRRCTPVLAAVLILAAAVFHVSVTWQEFPTLARNGYLYDDSFYAFQIARNIADGRGATFDGTNPTNGFQPLYVMMLVPLYRLFGPDPTLPIRAALLLMALFTAATAWLLFRIASRYVERPIALFTAALWVFSPVVVRQACNGLETALALFLLAASGLYYLEHVRSEPTPGRGRFLALGLLLGLAILARVDAMLLALAMVLDYLLVLRRRGGRKPVFARVGIAAAAALLVNVPWLVYGYVTVGSLFPESGVATRFLSIAYAPLFGQDPAQISDGVPGWGFIWAHLLHSMSVMKVAPPVHVFFRALEKLHGGAPFTGWALALVNAGGLLAMAGFVVWAIRRRRSQERSQLGEINFLVLFALLLVTAYSTWVFGAFFFMRYYYPVYFVGMVFAACFMQDLLRWCRRRARILQVVTVGAFALYFVGLFTMGINSAFRSCPVYYFYDVARWVDANTGEGETIGVFQAGGIGYLSGRKVVNLDGKVNAAALRALRSGGLQDYLVEARVNVVMDRGDVLRLFLGSWDEHGFSHTVASPCFDGRSLGARGWVGFRLSPAAAARAGASVGTATGSLRAP